MAARSAYWTEGAETKRPPAEAGGLFIVWKNRSNSVPQIDCSEGHSFKRRNESDAGYIELVKTLVVRDEQIDTEMGGTC
jgi:hypothetical protein